MTTHLKHTPLGYIPENEGTFPSPHDPKESAMTIPTRRPLPMASTGCACCAPAAAAVTAVETRAPSSASTATTYQVEGMTCAHCAGRVTEALTALEGVRDVQIDLVPGGASTVTVTSTAPVAAEAVRAAVARAGYAVVSS
jgi:copper chaperone CopZ